MIFTITTFQYYTNSHVIMMLTDIVIGQALDVWSFLSFPFITTLSQYSHMSVKTFFVKFTTLCEHQVMKLMA